MKFNTIAINISKRRHFGVDDNYSLNITTTKKLTKKEFIAISNCFLTIGKIIDPYMDEIEFTTELKNKDEIEPSAELKVEKIN